MGELKWALLVPGLVLAAWLALAIVRRPLLGVFILFACTILFDQFGMGPPSVLWRPEIYNNFNVTFGIGWLVVNPPEIVIGLMAAGWLAQAAAGRLPGRPLLAVSALGVAWFAVVSVAVWWGAVNGGNVKIGLWVLRPVFYFLALGFLTYQLVRTERQVAWLVGVALGAVTIKAVATIILWGMHRGDHPGWECYVSHEDTSFCLYALWMALAAFLIGAPRRLLLALLGVAPVLLAAVVFNDRRINFVTFLLGCALIIVAMPRGALTRRGLLIAGGAMAACLYVTVAVVGPENSLSRPVKGLVSGLQSELRNRTVDSSSQYRKLERYDLQHTIRAYPIMGAGLGVRYLQPIELPRLSFEYFVYITHNQVLMTHALMGPAAYFVLLLLFLTIFAVLLSYHRNLTVPWHRILALAAAASMANWLIVAFYDMQLFFFRNSIFMGVIIALPACLMRMQESRLAPPAPPPPPPQEPVCASPG